MATELQCRVRFRRHSFYFSTEVVLRIFHWQDRAQGYVEKERPLLFAGLRPQTYRVFVDGQLVHEQSGY